MKIAGLLFKIPHKLLSFLLTSLICYNEKISIRKKIKVLPTFEAEIIILEIKFYKGRNDSRANGKLGETTRGLTGKWAKRPGGETTRGERESGRNDSGANGKVGETTRIHCVSDIFCKF